MDGIIKDNQIINRQKDMENIIHLKIKCNIKENGQVIYLMAKVNKLGLIKIPSIKDNFLMDTNLDKENI